MIFLEYIGSRASLSAISLGYQEIAKLKLNFT